MKAVGKYLKYLLSISIYSLIVRSLVKVLLSKDKCFTSTQNDKELE